MAWFAAFFSVVCNGIFQMKVIIDTVLYCVVHKTFYNWKWCKDKRRNALEQWSYTFIIIFDSILLNNTILNNFSVVINKCILFCDCMFNSFRVFLFLWEIWTIYFLHSLTFIMTIKKLFWVVACITLSLYLTYKVQFRNKVFLT